MRDGADRFALASAAFSWAFPRWCPHVQTHGVLGAHACLLSSVLPALSQAQPGTVETPASVRPGVGAIGLVPTSSACGKYVLVVPRRRGRGRCPRARNATRCSRATSRTSTDCPPKESSCWRARWMASTAGGWTVRRGGRHRRSEALGVAADPVILEGESSRVPHVLRFGRTDAGQGRSRQGREEAFLTSAAPASSPGRITSPLPRAPWAARDLRTAERGARSRPAIRARLLGDRLELGEGAGSAPVSVCCRQRRVPPAVAKSTSSARWSHSWRPG